MKLSDVNRMTIALVVGVVVGIGLQVNVGRTVYNDSDEIQPTEPTVMERGALVLERTYTDSSITSCGDHCPLTPNEARFVGKYLANLDFSFIFPIVKPWTMVQEPEVKFVYDWILQLSANGIEGDIVECGVWKGGATMAMMFAALRSSKIRDFWLFDTFQGLPEPSEKDDAKAKRVWQEVQNGVAYSRQRAGLVEDGKWNYGPKAIVKNNIINTQYPWANVHLVEGKVENTLQATNLPEKIALLRLDTDWYDSTKIELEKLWDRLVPGGILFIDDYCAWGGSRRATDEFFNQRGLKRILKQYTKIKPCLYIVKPSSTS